MKPYTGIYLIAENHCQKRRDVELDVEELKQVQIVRVLVGHEGEEKDGDEALDDGGVEERQSNELELRPVQDKFACRVREQTE